MPQGLQQMQQGRHFRAPAVSCFQPSPSCTAERQSHSLVSPVWQHDGRVAYCFLKHSHSAEQAVPRSRSVEHQLQVIISPRLAAGCGSGSTPCTRITFPPSHSLSACRRLLICAADDPVMLGVLRDAQTQADQLRHRLAEYEARHIRQLHEICSLKQQLGLPTEEEEAALTAWAEHNGAAGAPVHAAAMPTSPATQQVGDGEQGDGGAGQPASPGLASRPELEPHTAGQPEATEGDPAGAGGSLSRVTRKKRGGSSGGAS